MAVTTVTTTMAGAINYTHVTDTSADWASVPNSTYFYDKADKLVHYKDGTGSILEIFSSAGGLTYFTEARSTTAPNTTTNVDSLSAGNGLSTTDIDVALVPRGTGAFLLDIPDSSITGGNKRGTNAIDLQIVRSSATQVASGNYSVGIGYGNTASNLHATAIGRENIANAIGSTSLGYTNTSSGSYSFSVGLSNVSSGNYSFTAGQTNTASGQYSIAMGNMCNATNNYSICIGGYTSSSTASAENSIVLGWGTASATRSNALGFANTASGLYSTALGYGANTNSIIGKIAIAGYYVDNRGDNQKGIIRLGRRTTDATISTLTADNSGTVNSTTQLTLQNQQLIRYKGSITGKQSGSINVAVWDIDGVIVRGANAGTTTLTISNINLVTNAPGWSTPTISADTTNGVLKIDVQGLAGTNIQWLAILDTIENLYL